MQIEQVEFISRYVEQVIDCASLRGMDIRQNAHFVTYPTEKISLQHEQPAVDNTIFIFRIFLELKDINCKVVSPHSV